MKTQTVEAISYCQNLLSFVFQNVQAGKLIKAVYLFGSAVRGELHKNSDIDLFIECEEKDEENVKRVVDSGIVKFSSAKDFEKWRLFKFTYPFAAQYGRLREWDVKLSIISEGLLLYGKSSFMPEGKRQVIFSIEYPKQKKDYIKLRRALFGRDEELFQDSGVIGSMDGKKISSHVFIIPQEEQSRMITLLSKTKTTFSMWEVILLES